MWPKQLLKLIAGIGIEYCCYTVNRIPGKSPAEQNYLGTYLAFFFSTADDERWTLIKNVRQRSDSDLGAAAAVVYPVQPPLALLVHNMHGHDPEAPCGTGGRLGRVVQHFVAGWARAGARRWFGL